MPSKMLQTKSSVYSSESSRNLSVWRVAPISEVFPLLGNKVFRHNQMTIPSNFNNSHSDQVKEKC